MSPRYREVRLTEEARLQSDYDAATLSAEQAADSVDVAGRFIAAVMDALGD